MYALVIYAYASNAWNEEIFAHKMSTLVFFWELAKVVVGVCDYRELLLFTLYFCDIWFFPKRYVFLQNSGKDTQQLKIKVIRHFIYSRKFEKVEVRRK